jgi:hypothetical protein
MIDLYVASLEAEGHSVHNPVRDVYQGDPTGYNICVEHLDSMRAADEVHVIWDVESKGSHFDLGMAFALGKPTNVVTLVHPDGEGKSYAKVAQRMKGRN